MWPWLGSTPFRQFKFRLQCRRVSSVFLSECRRGGGLGGSCVVTPNRHNRQTRRKSVLPCLFLLGCCLLSLGVGRNRQNHQNRDKHTHTHTHTHPPSQDSECFCALKGLKGAVPVSVPEKVVPTAAVLVSVPAQKDSDSSSFQFHFLVPGPSCKGTTKRPFPSFQGDIQTAAKRTCTHLLLRILFSFFFLLSSPHPKI